MCYLLVVELCPGCGVLAWRAVSSVGCLPAAVVSASTHVCEVTPRYCGDRQSDNSGPVNIT